MTGLDAVLVGGFCFVVWCFMLGDVEFSYPVSVRGRNALLRVVTGGLLFGAFAGASLYLIVNATS